MTHECKGCPTMTFDHKLFSRRRLTASVLAGVAAVAVAIGGYSIAHTGSGPSASAATAANGKVVPFHRGQPTPAKQVGQIPSSFSPGAGTIVTGTAANKAKAAALAAYPGGIVNCVVRLSDGQYNVQMIGVTWPHHVFRSKSFTVVSAE